MVQVLYVEGCPHWQATLETVRRTAAARELEAHVEAVPVQSHEDAVRLRFLGSPTVRIDGIDIDPAARARTDYALACRLYGAAGVPSREMIAAALDQSQAGLERGVPFVCEP